MLLHTCHLLPPLSCDMVKPPMLGHTDTGPQPALQNKGALVYQRSRFQGRFILVHGKVANAQAKV